MLLRSFPPLPTHSNRITYYFIASPFVIIQSKRYRFLTSKTHRITRSITYPWRLSSSREDSRSRGSSEKKAPARLQRQSSTKSTTNDSAKKKFLVDGTSRSLSGASCAAFGADHVKGSSGRPSSPVRSSRDAPPDGRKSVEETVSSCTLYTSFSNILVEINSFPAP